MTKWEATILKLNTLPFPREEQLRQAKSVNMGESHEFRKAAKDVKHSLTRYKYSTSLDGYELEYTWQWCKDCRKIWSKSVALFHDEETLVYQKFFVKKGENVING